MCLVSLVWRSLEAARHRWARKQYCRRRRRVCEEMKTGQTTYRKTEIVQHKNKTRASRKPGEKAVEEFLLCATPTFSIDDRDQTNETIPSANVVIHDAVQRKREAKGTQQTNNLIHPNGPYFHHHAPPFARHNSAPANRDVHRRHIERNLLVFAQQ